MTSRFRARFWFEATVSSISCLLAALTVFSRDWIEALTGFDPDHHSGWLEWAIVAGLLLLCAAAGVAARAERRRPTSCLSTPTG
jgi:hypothetical protein